jgi:serine protease inhibitor
VGAVLAATLAVAAACGGGDDDEPATGADVELITAGVERAAPSPSSPVDEVVTGIDAFGLRAERMLTAEGGGNTVLSPTSIAVAFAMVSAAADDATAERIAEVFGFPGEIVELVADRPYLFAVRHVETGAPLFVGRVADPRD